MSESNVKDTSIVFPTPDAAWQTIEVSDRQDEVWQAVNPMRTVAHRLGCPKFIPTTVTLLPAVGGPLPSLTYVITGES